MDGLRNKNLKGLVNINTASEVVLACISGLYDKASALVAARKNRNAIDRDITWANDVLTDQEVEQAGPFLTGNSYQVMLDVAAVGRYGRGYRREKVIIDNKSGTPKVVYRRSLGQLGWALGAEGREQLGVQEVVEPHDLAP